MEKISCLVHDGKVELFCHTGGKESCLVVLFRLEKMSCLVVFLLRLEERSVLFRLEQRRCLVPTGGEELSCCLVLTGGQELSCCLLAPTGGEELYCCLVPAAGAELSCPELRRGVVLFRLEERSCLVQN